MNNDILPKIVKVCSAEVIRLNLKEIKSLREKVKSEASNRPGWRSMGTMLALGGLTLHWLLVVVVVRLNFHFV